MPVVLDSLGEAVGDGHPVQTAHQGENHVDTRRHQGGSRADRRDVLGGSCPAGAPLDEGTVVDGHDVPVPHFGVLLEVEDFHRLAGRLGDAGVELVIAPHRRFAGRVGEQWTMFCYDPAGNAIEFKAFADDADVFRRDGPAASGNASGEST